MNGFQQFDVRGTDGPMTIQAAGNFLRFDSTSGQPIKLRADGQDLGTLWPGESVELPDAARAWIVTADAAETGVVRVGFGRIDSTRRTVIEKQPVLVMETGTAQVPGGGAAGWVSGTPANLAASGAVTVVFDLGPDWDQYGLAAIGVLPIGPSSGFSSVQAMGSDTAAANAGRRLKDAVTAGSGNSAFAISTGSNGHSFHVRPFGRYVIVTLANADAANALGATSKVSLAAYPT